VLCRVRNLSPAEGLALALAGVEGRTMNKRDKAVSALDEWIKAKGIDPKTLPERPWELPKDCPIWSMGLSMAQAWSILDEARNR
jgi:hypothetical protein